MPVFLVQAANDYSTVPIRELTAELARLGRPHQTRVFPAFGLTADEGHVFARDGALVGGDEVRAFLNRWMEATERGVHLEDPTGPTRATALEEMAT